MATQDFTFTDDLVFRNGDIQVTVSDNQHIEHLLEAYQGQFYQNPLAGIGIQDEINGSSTNTQIKQKIKIGLRFDDFRIERLLVQRDIDDLFIDYDAVKEK